MIARTSKWITRSGSAVLPLKKKGKPLAVYPVLNERASSTNEWTFFFFFFSFRVLMVRFFLPLRLLLLLLPSLPHFCHIFFKTWLDDVKTNLYPEIPAEKRLRRRRRRKRGRGEKHTISYFSPTRARDPFKWKLDLFFPGSLRSLSPFIFYCIFFLARVSRSSYNSSSSINKTHATEQRTDTGGRGGSWHCRRGRRRRRRRWSHWLM